MTEKKPVMHEAKIVVQKPEPRKIPKLYWVLGAILLLFLIVGAGVWLANILINLPATPVIVQ